jgi:preprotein translocase subunit SecY
MITAFANIFKIPELRARVLFTLAAIVIVRAGSSIATPGVNAEVLRQWFIDTADAATAGGVAALFNLFSGGALSNCAIFSLGVMPFISCAFSKPTSSPSRWKVPKAIPSFPGLWTRSTKSASRSSPRRA